ncbi:MAG TPA: SDR family NAD(P)-dependent oxidoreductase [Acidimicrobiales bacterium]|nr:SDR family NAD(P)-dependent oxidoreductase [Acidimicrobiales bacterium]
MNDAFNHPQSVVVLGGTSEIGHAVVSRLVADRCRTIVLAGRDRAALELAADGFRTAGAEVVEVVDIDVVGTDRAEDAVAACFAAAGGQVDLVLITLGLLGDSQADAMNEERIAATLAVNFSWPAVAMASAARRLRDQGSGRIVVFSSVAGVRIRAANFIYGAAKSGLDGFALGLGETLRGSGVLVQVVRPGFVHTKMTAGLRPAPFAVDPNAVARAVVTGMARNQAVIWVPSILRWVFAALRLLPQAVWRRLPG